MNLGRCRLTRELQMLLQSGAWPLAASPELRAHVATCPECTAHARLTLGLRSLREQSMAAAPVLSPGLIWWRAQLRRRNEALAHIERPLMTAQILVLVVLLAACGSAFCLGRLPLRGLFPGWKLSSLLLFDPAWRWPLLTSLLALALAGAALLLDFVLERAQERR